MINDEELESLLLEKKKQSKGELTKEEKEENIITWCTFERRNLDIFNEDYLEIDISFFQKH